MRLAKQGDAQAFSALYELYFTPIFRFIYFRVQSREEAEDLVQTVFLKVFRSLPNFHEQNASPLAYFYTVARNAIIDYWRKKKSVSLEDYEEMAENILDDKADPFESLERLASAKILRKALGVLTDEQREVIVLKFINELSNKEIAQLISKNEGAIRQIQCRALKAMRDFLKNREKYDTRQ